MVGAVEGRHRVYVTLKRHGFPDKDQMAVHFLPGGHVAGQQHPDTPDLSFSAC